MNDIQVV